MTSTVSPRYRRSASLLLGGLLVTAHALLGAAPHAGAEPTTEAITAIDDRYTAFGGDASLLGVPVADVVDVPGGAARDYSGGAIYYSADTGAHVMYGAILDRYRALGGPSSELGFPTNDESDTGDGTGRFNDFTTPGGAAMYWTPQWGASVVKGRVLEAWRQSGAVTGPFGYPSADTTVIDGVQTGKFVGPDGTQIQWSADGGLVTIPAAVAGTIPGFSAVTPTPEGTTAVATSTPAGSASSPTSLTSSKWWWIPVGLAVAALLAGLVRLLRRRPVEPAPVKIAAQRVPEVVPAPMPAPRPAPVAATPPPPPPRPPAPAPTPPPAPTRIAPLAHVPPRPAAPPPPAWQPLVTEPPTAKIAAATSELPKATIRSEAAEKDLAPVITYETPVPTATTTQVTYRNNAVGTDQESVADKSDSTRD